MSNIERIGLLQLTVPTRRCILRSYVKDRLAARCVGRVSCCLVCRWLSQTHCCFSMISVRYRRRKDQNVRREASPILGRGIRYATFLLRTVVLFKAEQFSETSYSCIVSPLRQIQIFVFRSHLIIRVLVFVSLF
jgi:hypothetical protein